MRPSKYWQFELLESEAIDNWRAVLNKSKYSGIISPPRTREIEEGQDSNVRANRKYRPKHYIVIVINKEPVTSQEMTRLSHLVQGRRVKRIDDTLRLDGDLKKAIRKACNYQAEHKYNINKFSTFGNTNWNEYEHFVKPWIYTKTVLIEKRHWTKKCLSFLPDPDSTYTFRGLGSARNYAAWSEDIIYPLELDNEFIRKTIAKKTSSDYQSKMQIKRQKAIATKKRKKQQVLTKYKEQFEQKFEELTQNVDSHLKELTIILEKMTILNHVAKFVNDYTNYNANGNLKIDPGYTTQEIYKTKDKLLHTIYKNYSNLLKLRVFVPDNPDKTYVNLCDYHVDLAHDLGIYIPEFIDEYYLEINNCQTCQVNVDKNYYVCYDFQIEINNELKFDYHLPYPLGKSTYPEINKLQHIEQMPNESGPYLFGHEADEAELYYVKGAHPLEDIKNWIRKQTQ